MNPGGSRLRHDDLTARAGLAEQDLPASALYVVAMPIGNAADITLRALWVLAHVDAIAAEDTRVTGPLLARYGIDTPLTAVHQHNERAAAAAIVERLRRGERVALATDAGTPGISDPGAVVVRAALDAGLRVVPIPGASSLLAGLSAAGLETARFRFVGFLPSGAREREQLLREVASAGEPSVLFEAPHRIRAMVDALARVLEPDRRVVVGRELTKKFESITAQPASKLASSALEERGEYVIVIDAAKRAAASELDEEGRRWLEALLEELTPARAAAVVSRVTGVPRQTVYDIALGMRRSQPVRHSSGRHRTTPES
jgi:16S rRNA (cytidine1402-2'-O)-methyltransferase